MAGVPFQHFTSRPTVDIAMTDKAGVEYTEADGVHDPNVKPDSNSHTHNAILANVMTESGKGGAHQPHSSRSIRGANDV
jgi:hypothetical protein